MEPISISLDAMGGDHGAAVVVPAALRALKHYPNLHLILVGDQAILDPAVKKFPIHLRDRVGVQHASEIVGMDESPSQALRYKKDSSMRTAINLVKDGMAQACVSAGNTGALMATSKFVLKTIPGIDRPAILACLPSLGSRRVYMLDLGANVDSTPEQLVQFAVMGSVSVAAIEGVKRPQVGLLNVGEEDIKGNWQVKQTAELLNKVSAINYSGYVEGDSIFKGEVDVVVCDGFVGNISLKTTEGAARLFASELKASFLQNPWSRFVGLLALPMLKQFRQRIDPSQYNGATLVGLQGIVIKSHGGASIKGFAHAIEAAIIEVEKDLPQQIHTKVLAMLEEII